MTAPNPSYPVVPPRLTTTARDALATVAAGMVIYNTTTVQLEQYTGSAWAALGGGGAPSGAAGGALDGTYPNPGIAASVAGAGLTETSDVLAVGAGTGVTVNANDIAVNYGTSGTTACVGNDSRLSDSRAPSGSAGGDLTGTYPNPTVDANKITNAKLATMAQATVKGRASGAGTGNAADLTSSDLTTILGLGTAAFVATGTFDAAGAAAAAQAASQPVDADLTAIAALSTSSFGRALLALADAAGLRTAAALGTAATSAISDFDAAGTAASAVAAHEADTTNVHGIVDTSTVVLTTDSRLSDVRPGAYDPGTITVATEKFLVQYRHLKLASSERMTIAGTAEVVLTDLHANDTVILGTPKQPPQSFVVPDGYLLTNQIGRLTLVGSIRATLQGSADLFLSDDFARRSRIVLG